MIRHDHKKEAARVRQRATGPQASISTFQIQQQSRPSKNSFIALAR